MDPEKRAFYVGIPLLILGIVILLFTLVQAFTLIGNAGSYMERQLPSQGPTGNPPQAGFFYVVDNFTATFQDTSSEGSSPIVSWEWDFGDGEMSSEPNPTHVYASEGDYPVQLTVTDSENRRSQANTGLRVGPGESGNGTGSWSPAGAFDVNMDFGTVLLPLSIALLAVILFVVMFLVGASITKAGWNLIRPRPETVKVRVKPKDIEVEPVEPEPSPPAIAAPAPPPPQMEEPPGPPSGEE